MTRWIYFGVVLAFQVAAAPPVSEKHAAEMARGLALFKSDVRAVLKQHCVKCHGGDKTRGGLDLTTRASLLKGGDEGVIVIPGNVFSQRDTHFRLSIAADEEKLTEGLEILTDMMQ